ncbi:MAG: sulfatase, partial [Cyclobacteriaceae bacterium]|nr:sulfatase [Cyclobacteriaceae bacterium]
PNIDKLASESANCYRAISGMPVCSPFRATLMTGQRPLTHGVFMNDVQLDTGAVTIAKVMSAAGYQTANIGKWHIDGKGRSSFIPPGNRRQGFQYWKTNECTHNYNHSQYYADSPDTLLWEGYDAISQTTDAEQYIINHAKNDEPFFLLLSWGPPHAPYHTAPQKYRDMYEPEKLFIRPNVTDNIQQKVKNDLAGYYAHCSALDELVGNLRRTLKTSGTDDNTIILFVSDHGDLLGSHGYYKKQQPYDESIRIPMLYYIPAIMGGMSAKYDALINADDIMPTLLGLCDIPIPETVEGIDYSDYLRGGENPGDTLTWISCVQPFGQWSRNKGGKEYRGYRSKQYTYTRDMAGPWQLFDNDNDPYQMRNIVGDAGYKSLVNSFDSLLEQELIETKDQFLGGLEYAKIWNYELDENETVPYTR